jgi:Zn-dependent protease
MLVPIGTLAALIESMKWNYNIMSIAGTQVRIHLTFVVLLAWIALAGLMTAGPLSAFSGVLFVVLLFACVLAHEFGHVLAARAVGIHTPDVTLYPIGGVARLDRMPEKPLHEIFVALAGPAVNVVIAAGLMFLMGAGAILGGLNQVTDSSATLLGRLAVINIWLALFNLIPAFPMDGGRVLRAILTMVKGYLPATRLAVKIGRVLAIVFGLIGLIINPMLTIVAIFIYMAAGQELFAVENRYRAREFINPLGDLFKPNLREQTVPVYTHRRPTSRPMPVLDENGQVIGWMKESDSVRGRHRYAHQW